MEQILHFMKKCEGSWISHRRYIYYPKQTIVNAVNEFTCEFLGLKEIKPLQEALGQPVIFGNKITWHSYPLGNPSKTISEGEIVIAPEGDKLYRSRGYSTMEKTHSEFTCDKGGTKLQTITSYGGEIYDEEILFLVDDHRIRKKIGRDLETGVIKLVGQYFEHRI